MGHIGLGALILPGGNFRCQAGMMRLAVHWVVEMYNNHYEAANWALLDQKLGAIVFDRMGQ